MKPKHPKYSTTLSYPQIERVLNLHRYKVPIHSIASELGEDPKQVRKAIWHGALVLGLTHLQFHTLATIVHWLRTLKMDTIKMPEDPMNDPLF
jgi:hypothetical protein